MTAALRAARGHRRTRLVAAASAMVVLLAGCKVDIRLVVAADDDGSGSVTARFTLDAAAVETLGGDVESRLRVADLIQAGWDVDVEPAEAGTIVEARKAFSRPEELTGVIEELSGDTGPFRDFRLERSRSQFRTSFEFRGDVDLGAGVGASALDPGDDSLAAELSDEGIDVQALREFLGDRLDRAFSFEIVAALPGDGSHNAPGTISGEPTWRPSVGERVALRASSSDLDEARIALVALGAVLFLGAVALAATGRRRARRAVGEREPG